jgi:hypothetical protein
MGEGWEGIAASSIGGENNGLGSCKAHHFGSRTQEDRSGAASAMGEVEGGEEGGVDVTGPAASVQQAFASFKKSAR